MSGSLRQLLDRIAAIDIRLWVEDGRLRYDAPEGAMTDEVASALRAHRDELIEHFRDDRPTLHDLPPIRPRAATDDAPLSFAQQRLWFLDQLGAGAAYNMRLAMRLTGALDEAALRSALAAVVDRHVALRTSFPAVDGRPVQRVAPTAELPFASIDLRHLDADERERHAHALVDEEILRPFDLERGPVVGFRLYRLDDDDHVLLFTVHHIVFDGWSIGVFTRELSAHYRAFVAGEPPAIDALPLQYADFAAWQREWMEAGTLDDLLGYWLECLGPEVPELELPADRPRPAVQSFDGGLHTFHLPPDLGDAVETLGQRAGVTPAMTLLAAFSTLLARYTRQDDIVVGSPIANRVHADVEGLIGFFVNALVLRTDVSGDPTFAELLARVRDVSLGAYDHQDLPFERLVEELNPERDPSRSPVFQIMFAMQNAPPSELTLPGVDVRPFEFGVMTTRFDLEVHIDADDDGLRVRMVYAKQLFDGPTIERMGRHFARLLEAAMRDPDRPISRLPLLDTAEREQVVTAWNDTAAAYPNDECVHTLVAAQAARTPDAIAATYGDASLTYRELDEQANRIARHLQSLGVRRGTMVGICLERSETMVAAMLGVLKAGGAYVPLEPTYPAERLQFMLDDTRAPVVLTTSAVAAPLEASGTRLVRLDVEAETIGAQPATPPAVDVSAGDTAYVIYTSGSTGRAKGVCVPHRAINRLVVNTDYVQLRDTDRIAQASNANFDAATFEIWGALIHGARLVGVSKDTLLAPPHLAAHVREHGINVLFVTTALFNELVREVPDIFAGFRYVLFGGQAVDPRWPRRALEHGRPEHLLHVYGPTETTTYATWHEITDVPADAATIPIGRGLANTTVYVLDADMRPTPIGLAGELYIGGPGVATGYLDRPALTAERYVPDPFAATSGARLYRTGDLVRWNAAGAIEFIGRVDHQVKVRGFRIELGEIESSLNQHDAVQASVVTVDEDTNGDKRLIAYVVPALETRDAIDVDRDTSDRVDQWQRVYDDVIYKDIDEEPAAQDDPRFNIVGWKSTYTGEPLGADEMREQVDQTVARMLDGKHDRVLELGCGTGLLLFPVAPHCAMYCGTDFSGVALDYVREQLGTLGASGPDVRLSQRLADDFTDIDADAFDLAVLNSVVQYFPSIDYLDAVLTGAVRAVAPGGRIFVGDVRSLPLLETFLTSVEAHQAAGAPTPEQLAQRVHQALIHEQELVIDPEYFVALRDREPRISHVQILLKRGHARNELTKYRYDVMLHIADARPAVTPAAWRDWEQDRLSLAALRRDLGTANGAVALRRVPNARVGADAALLHAAGADANGAAQRTGTAGIDPETLWSLGAELGYDVTIGWSDAGVDGRFDAVFTKRDANRPAPVAVTPLTATTPRRRDLRAYGTNPLRAKLVARLVPDLRAHVDEHLPEYMMPSAFVLLDALPLTPNGKVDRRALPAPDAGRPELSSAYEAPRTRVEERLAGIWSDVLGIERVGVRDDFFELGGHSLLATQVVSRMREAFEVELPLQALFDHPTIETLGAFVQGAEAETLRTAPIVPVPRDGELPLSFAQQRLWFLDQLYPGRFGYNQAMALRLRGDLDRGALARSLDELVRRHESLRTAFRSDDGVPGQVILAPTPRELPVVDLADRSAGEREVAARRHAVDEMRRPFDLSAGVPIRATLLRLDARDHVLLLTLHHIVSDGWSLGVLNNELGALYAAFARGEPSPLTPLAVQYADFAGWQRQWLSGSVWDEQLRYWKSQLTDVTPLALPTDRPRPAEQTFAAARERLVLPKRLAAAIDAFGRDEHATPFMTLLAVFTILLRRYGGQDDIVVGSPIANRNRLEVEPLIGFFVNSLVMRTDLSGHPSFRELVTRVRQSALGAYAHQDIPFEHLVEALQPDRDLSRSPLFQVLFAVQNVDTGRLTLPGVDVRPLDRGESATRFDLELHVHESEGGLEANFVYNTDLFDATTIERMTRHYRRLLEAALADPDGDVDALAILDAAEREQLVVAWNDTTAAHPDVCLHEPFERQAARTPNEVALVDGDRSVRYADLDARANALAHRLRERGVGPDVPVGIHLARNADMVTAILATLKAGGAYLPLDPAYPRERIRYMLEDAGAPVVVSDRALGDLDDLAAAAEIVHVDDVPTRTDNPEVHSGVRPGHIAYIIYTSGSTGRPKGVAITHANATALVAWARTAYDDADLAGVLAGTSMCFDLSVFEMFVPLCSGGTVVLAENAMALPTLPARDRVTLINTVPSAMAELVRQDAIPRSVRTVNLAGEPLMPALVDAIYDAGVDRVFDLYGPSEATTYTTGALRERGGPATIGRPLANERVYLLDGCGEPVPVGVAGEMYVGGRGVARGYVGDPGLTATKFVPDPFSGEAGARLYRTGDLARYRADGAIEFLGRVDHQVKLRGFRIELGEIESVLCEHPSVREATVLVRKDGPDDPRLVAYVAVNDAVTDRALRAYVVERMPQHMVPSAFAVLDTMPHLPNGKVDRKALDAITFATDVGSAGAAPRNPTEAAVAELFAETLQCDHASIHDDFFDLGGHSLLGTRLIARLRKVFQADLPLSTLFESPTVARLAERIDAARSAGAGEPLTSIPVLPRDAAAPPLSFAQQRLWFLDEIGAGAGYNMPFALRMTGDLDVAALQRSLDTLVTRHDVLRTVFPTENGAPRPLTLATMNVPLRLIDGSALPEAERDEAVNRIAADEAEAPFDLTGGPLFRAVLVRRDPDDHVLLLTFHHIVSDGWSHGLFGRELMTSYGALVRGETPDLPPLTVQYADFAAWQRERLRGERLERELGYWREQLRDLPTLGMPTDRPRPPVQTFAGAAQDVTVPAALAETLRDLGRRTGVTQAMLLLAAFTTLLARYANEDDVVVGTPIANRTHPDVENLIGVFINTLVMRTSLDGDPAFTEILQRVRAACLDAYDHQELPFERLVEALNPTREMSANPLFQVGFTLQNLPDVDLEVPGLTAHPMRLDVTTARIDLELHLIERDGGLVGRLVYNTDLFDDATITRFAHHYVRLLERVAAAPETRLSDFALLDPDEAQTMLVDWNRTDASYADDACIHELFAARVREAPDAVAVLSDDAAMSYAELDARANQVAHVLRDHDAGRDVLVALCADRGPDLIVGLLGILKAGSAYLPLDPNYPPERLAFMLADSGAPILLTQERQLDALPARDAVTLCLDRDAATFDRAPTDDPAAGARPDDLAYAIYTSGSTGTPKGALLAHRGLCSLSAQQAAAFGVGPGSRVLQFSSPSFDAATFEIVMALPKGGTLVTGAADALLPGPDLLELLRRHRVSIVTLPPTALAALPEGELPDLETITVAGEACSADLVARWAPGRRFFNLYGPTEATIWSTMTQLAPGDPVHIGRPIGNVQTYVLDAHLNPVPVGVVGELHVAGIALARGYLARPALTAERFIPNPFSGEPGERMYKTGDLARYRADGTLEFVGRADGQVKVRGYRIELGEIEAALARIPDVQESVVLCRNDGAGDKQLVAYAVCRGHAPTARDLRTALGRGLPEFMLPSAFVFLDAMPVTANGKLDRAALPAPSADRREQLETDYEAGRTPVERILADAWARVLRVERVGIHDNFFELGGDSILSIQAVAVAREAGVVFSARDLVQNQTVAAIASAATTNARLDAEQGVVTGPIRLTPIQRWFFDHDPVDPHHFNQAFLFELRDPVEPAWLADALDALLEHHDALRSRVHRDGAAWRAEIAPLDAGVPLEVVDLRETPPDDHDERIEQVGARLQAGLDLTAGPIMRAAFFRTGGDSGDRVLLVAHHAAVDAVSWSILLPDLERALDDRRAGRPIELPRKTTSVRAWAESLASRAPSSEVRADAERWLDLPWSDVQPLPVDRDAGPNIVASSAHIVTELGTAETEAILRTVPATLDAKVDEILLAACALALAPWLGSGHVAIDLEGHGRDTEDASLDLARTVGWFTVIYPVLLDVGAAARDADAGALLPSLQTQLARARETRMSFGMARDLARDERLLALPRAQISFNYVGQLDHVMGRETAFRRVSAPIGPARSPRAQRLHLLAINSSVMDGRLRVDWAYSRNLHDEATIRQISETFERALIDLTQHEPTAASPAKDSDRFGWSEHELDDLLSDVERLRGKK